MNLSVGLAVRTQGDVHVSTVVRLVGTLDPTTVPVAERETKTVLAAPPRVVVFDLSGVDFVTSAGVSFLLNARQRMEGKGATVFFSSPQPQVRKVLDILKVLPPTSVFTSVRELDAYLAEIQRKVAEGE